jgi:N-acetylmuramoyl-L-alanine amidase
MISGTHRMKRLLISLVPWMAMTAAAQQDVARQAEVIYTNVGPAAAWRIGDECYVAPSVLTSWHWPFTIVDSTATIQAEGRTVRVPTKIVRELVLIPVHSLFEQLGGQCRWRTESDQMEVRGQVRMVSLQNGSLQIDSTLSSRPHVFSLTDPSRLVIDMRGMLISPLASSTLPPNVHASQYGPDTVRVVYESPNIPRIPSNIEDASRHFEIKTDFPVRPAQNTGSPDLVNPRDPATQPPVIGNQQPSSTGSSRGGNVAGSFSVSNETSRALTLSLSLGQPLSGSVKLRRVDPFDLDVVLPGVTFRGPTPQVDSPSIERVRTTEDDEGAVLHIRMTRPMGVVLSTGTRSIDLLFLKPSVGNAKLAGKTVVVDPGHGGGDTGARSPNHDVLEKDLTLSIGKLVADELAAQGASVIMTRKSDVFIPLKERPAIANRSGADFFVSVHINSNTQSESHSGTITFFHGHSPISQLLAECIEHEIGDVSGIPALGAWSDTRIYGSGFAVLRYSQMPAVLVETGFINSSVDRAKMCTQAFQEDVAKAIVRGIKVFLGDAKE